MNTSDQEISFSNQSTLEDALDLNRYYALYVFPRWSRRALAVLTPLVVLGAILLQIRDTRGITPQWLFVAAWSVAALSLLLYAILWFLPQLTAAAYRRQPERSVEYRVSFSKDSVTLAAPDFSTRMPWRRIARLIDTPDGLMFLYSRYQPAMWLPARLFDGNDRKQRILDFAGSASVRVQALGGNAGSRR